MMECWFTDTFGHDFENKLLNKYKGVVVKNKLPVGTRPIANHIN
ncbi:MAG: hypothetical protein ACFFDN_44385 [Candidatus Hodarchaeota archaeon]